MTNKLNKKEAIEFLSISEKMFENYFRFSKEITGKKIGNRWYFDKNKLDEWKKSKDDRTISLIIKEYEKSFEFAIKMVYGGLALHGIRGKRTEVQAADDVILGILAEHAIKKFLKEKFNTEIKLDEDIHTGYITPQDFDFIKENNKFRKPKLGVGVKASKLKNAFLILGANEVDLLKRKS
ncbi:helix-turn-helix domain-containing protein, partial [Patescibacteria group bacterium]|nr:helix-turn-helix domain-containing protein [Patescibacteria group bacterium]